MKWKLGKEGCEVLLSWGEMHTINNSLINAGSSFGRMEGFKDPVSGAVVKADKEAFDTLCTEWNNMWNSSKSDD